MEKINLANVIKLPNFSGSNDIRFRISPRFYNEGPKQFRVMLKYKIIKIYEESKSDPISMTLTKNVKFR